MSTGWAITNTQFDAEISSSSKFTVTGTAAYANHFVDGYNTTATAAGTTTLLATGNGLLNARNQFFTGTTTQTILLPVTSTLTLGEQFNVFNNSTGIITVRSSTPTTLQAMSANTRATFTVTSTASESWDVQYSVNPAGFATTDLGNVASTAVSADLLPSATNLRSIGSTVLKWANGWFERIYLRTGTNATCGTGTLSGGVATIVNNNSTTGDVVLLSNTGGGSNPQGGLFVTSFTGGATVGTGTGFTIASDNLVDDNNFSYTLIHTFAAA